MEFVLKPMRDLHQFRSEESVSDRRHKDQRSKQIEWITLNSMAELGKDTWDLLVVVFLQWFRKIEFFSARGCGESRLDETEKQNRRDYDRAKVFHLPECRARCLAK